MTVISHVDSKEAVRFSIGAQGLAVDRGVYQAQSQPCAGMVAERAETKQTQVGDGRVYMGEADCCALCTPARQLYLRG